MASAGEIPRLVPGSFDVMGLMEHLPVLGKRIGGSSSPDFVRLQLIDMPDVDPDSIAWAEEIPGDPKANPIPRWCHNVAVIGVGQDELSGLGAHDTESGRWAKDALVMLSEGGEVRVGVNPVSDHLFGGEAVRGERMFTVAKRLGRDPLRAALGQYRPDENRLYMPEVPATVVRKLMPDSKLHGEKGSYPNTKITG